MSIEPDTKDWTWVLAQACGECGYDAGLLTDADLAPTIRANAEGWAMALAEPGVTDRPSPQVWSPAEYACHVRDVHLIFGQRLSLMLAEDDPVFANWDQDVTAVQERYDRQDPTVVGPALVEAARAAAATYDGVPPDAWQRTGRRSNGSVFTVATLGRYHLHDVVHHLWDIGFDPVARTLRAYDAQAADYAAARATLDPVTRAIDDFAATIPGGRVLEIGSGPGHDAAALEARGVSVRRTDLSPGFVDHLRAAGFEADLIDPRCDDLGDPADPERPYDGVWANASLLHVDRWSLPGLLARLAEVTRPGGVLAVTLKQGDGEGWSTHGSIAAPRRFTYWRADPLREVLTRAGWSDINVVVAPGQRGETWLEVTATR